MWSWLLIGCSSGFVETPACDLEPYGWSDDVLGHLLQGEGDGSFAFDPVDEPRSEVAGAYYPATGEFTWSTSYVNQSYLVSSDVEGYGTVYHSGDLDLLWATETTDVLDAVSTTETRLVREGCKTEWWTWPEGEEASYFYQSGSFTSADRFEWTAEADGVTYDGSMSSDASRTAHYTLDDDTWEATEATKPDGTSRLEFEGTAGCLISGMSCEGAQEFALNGDFTYETTLWDGGDDYAEAVGEFEYDGDGELVIEFEAGVACTYTYDEGDCDTYTCDNGDDGSC